MHLAVAHMAEQYNSPVVGLKLGNERTIVVLTHEVVHQVHTQEEYEGRPYNFFIKLRCMGARKGELKHEDQSVHTEVAVLYLLIINLMVTRNLQILSYRYKFLSAIFQQSSQEDRTLDLFSFW